MKYLRVALLCAAASSAVSTVASASPIVTSFTPTATFTGGDYYLGFQFRADTNKAITQLGFYDANRDGLSSSHTVGLYSLDGTLLGSVTVGVGDTLIGDFRYANLTSAVTLVAGTSYRLAGTTAGSDDWVYQADALATDGVTYEESQFRFDNSTNAPDSPAPGREYYTVNAFDAGVGSAVPEPATWAMMTLGFGAIGFAMRRRTTVTTRIKLV